MGQPFQHLAADMLVLNRVQRRPVTSINRTRLSNFRLCLFSDYVKRRRKGRGGDGTYQVVFECAALERRRLSLLGRTSLSIGVVS